jgi:hypothetical protein
MMPPVTWVATECARSAHCGRDPRAYRWGTVHIAVRIERARRSITRFNMASRWRPTSPRFITCERLAGGSPAGLVPQNTHQASACPVIVADDEAAAVVLDVPRWREAARLVLHRRKSGDSRYCKINCVDLGFLSSNALSACGPCVRLPPAPARHGCAESCRRTIRRSCRFRRSRTAAASPRRNSSSPPDFS